MHEPTEEEQSAMIDMMTDAILKAAKLRQITQRITAGPQEEVTLLVAMLAEASYTGRQENLTDEQVVENTVDYVRHLFNVLLRMKHYADEKAKVA
jgi:hypothetical protein